MRSLHPDAIFLSEAFTRPKMMYRLAKIGFSQSYTYFTWRNEKRELEDYFRELADGPARDFFRPHLFAALTLVDRGDLTLDEMYGAWAGELGQTQFLPDNHLKFAVDFDGDGRRDLVRSVPDVLASTANLLASSGWKRGESYEEGTANFEAMREWNHATIYRKTIAYFADQLVGR